MNKIISIFLIVLGSVNLASAEQACTARNCSNCERMFVFNHEIQKMASSNLERSTYGVLSEIENSFTFVSFLKNAFSWTTFPQAAKDGPVEHGKVNTLRIIRTTLCQ